ncbi:MAG: GNAT family N-acetyltransferase [Gammaproteobacteria bacterium]|nr:GNAT family N-acetyltransferase [Gammaproteobacteria bacterium]
MPQIIYRQMKTGEEQAVSRLVEHVFNEFVAADLEPAGIAEFFRFANPVALRARRQPDGFVLVACQGDDIVGMLEFIPPDRIAMLFVSLRGQGIAGELLAGAIRRIRANNPQLVNLTVNSSLYAEPFYRKLGFQPTADATTVNGIRFIPMQRSLAVADV